MRDLKQMFDGYDCGIRQADIHAGMLFEALEKQGVMDDLVIIISSDHGENMGELGAYAEHGIFAYLEKRAFQRRAFLQTVDEARAACGLGRELEGLTARERETLALLAQGMTNKDIAQSLILSVRTVEAHLRNIFGKLGVRARTEAALWATKHGYGPEDR